MRLEVISGQSLEVIADIKRELASNRSDCDDTSGHIQELEQQISVFMVSLDSFKLKVTKVQQEQSRSPSSDTNSRSYTEVRCRQCIHIHSGISHIYKSIAISITKLYPSIFSISFRVLSCLMNYPVNKSVIKLYLMSLAFSCHGSSLGVLLTWTNQI